MIKLLLFLCPVYGFLPKLPDYIKYDVQTNLLNLGKLTEYLEDLGVNNKIGECVRKLKEMVNHFLSDPAMLNFIRHSGKGLGDIGDYDTCESTNTSYYAIFYLKVNYAAGVRTAFCVPKECHPEVIELTKPFLAALANFAVDGNFSAEQITFEYPKEDNKELNKLKPQGLAFYIGSYALIAFSLILTALDQYGYFSVEDPQPTTWKKIAVCFSLKRNLHTVFNTENKYDYNLNILNGIRVISLCWIVMGHFTVALGISPIANLPELVHSTFHTWFMGIVKAGNLASDTFFLLSGFFSSMSIYRIFVNSENRSIKMVLWMYLRRYIRLFPVFMFGILGATFIMPTLYDSPLSSWSGPQVRMCEEQWLYCLTYINNYISGFYDSCMGWLWYIHADMQFYLLVPILFLIYFSKRKVMYMVMFLLAVGSLIVQILIVGRYKYNLSAFKLDNENDMNTMVFMKPYCRIWTYLMGIILFLMYESRANLLSSIKQIILNQTIIRRICYFLALLILLLSIYSFFYLDDCPECWGDTFGMFHIIAIRPFFIFGVTLIIYPVIIGKGRLLLSILGHFIFCHVSKVSYGIYMLHLPLIGIMRFVNTHGRIILPFDIVIGSLTIVLMSYVFSGVVTVLYEYPVMCILKTVVENKIPKDKHEPLIKSTN